MVALSDYFKSQDGQGFYHLSNRCISGKLHHTTTSARKVSLISFASKTSLPKVSM